jgi:hypothetical protein
MSKKGAALCLIILIGFSASSQVKHEVIPPDHIKTIIFKGSDDNDQFPIIKLGESVRLEFDDISAEEDDYYYKIMHCNFDWTPSDIIKSQYLEGFDNERITNYKNSLNTLVTYSHYSLSIPNRKTRLLLSGNYIIEIYTSNDALLFSRRFVIYENSVGVGVQIKRARDLTVIDQKQVVQFKINSGSLAIRDPKREIKVHLIKNYDWKHSISNLQPQYTLGNTLEYRYDKEAYFNGGNEYLRFDTKDTRAASINVYKVQLDDIYHHFLYTDEIRAGLPYTYFPDINGDFLVRNVSAEDVSIEGDYTWVHFSIPYKSDFAFDKVYVLGKFNNYEISESCELVFNPESKLMEGVAFMKQGFYNYKYVTVNAAGVVEDIKISGSHYETENNYTVLVYYRKFGDLYDSLIGVGVGDSSTITN